MSVVKYSNICLLQPMSPEARVGGKAEGTYTSTLNEGGITFSTFDQFHHP